MNPSSNPSGRISPLPALVSVTLIFLSLSVPNHFLPLWLPAFSPRAVPGEFITLHHQAPPPIRRMQAQGIFFHSCYLCGAGWEECREGKGWICGLKQPLDFTHINNDTAFSFSSRKIFDDNTPIYYQQAQPWFYCLAGFCLYWNAFHSQFSLGQTRKGMHLEHNKCHLKEKRD